MPDYRAAIVIDIGTTNCKVSCFSCTDATMPGMRRFATPKEISPQGAVDFAIELLWRRLKIEIAALAAASPAPIACISIASFGESGLFIDAQERILTPMPAWYDRRGEEYLAALSPAECERLYAISGLPAHSNYSAFKMRWLLEHYRLTGRRDICWLHAPEVLLWRLTGERRTDLTLASRTLCLDVASGKWSAAAAAILQIPPEVFAPLLRSGEEAGRVTPALCRELGLAADARVVLAGHDHMAGARALQLQPGEVLNSTGTTEGILVLNTHPVLDAHARRDKLANGCYSAAGYYTLFASLPVGGYAHEWLRQTFRLREEEIAAALSRLWHRYRQGGWPTESAPIFIPHLRGSGSPNKSRHTRGLLYGLADNSDLDALVGSVFLGLAMEFANCYTCFALPAGRAIKVIGPAVNNPLWLQLKADILQTPVDAMAFDEAVSVGALLIACPDISPAGNHLAARYLPDRQRTLQLQRYQQRWLEFYRLKLQLEGVAADQLSPHAL